MSSNYRNLISLKAFLPKESYILKLIEICQLNSIWKEWETWFDIYNNKLIINKYNKNIIIKYNKNYNEQELKIKDIYAKAHIKYLSKINKFSLISIKNKNYYIWMLDNNNILRLCYYKNNILLENIPILKSGLKNLKQIVSFLDVEDWTLCSSIIEPETKDLVDFSYATSWPPKKDLLNLIPDIIKKDCDL